MKKIISLVFISLLLFAACEPITNKDGVGAVITSADQLEVTITPVTVNSKKSNKVLVKCTSPVVCHWTDGVENYIGNELTMILFVAGEQTITLTAMTYDGNTFTKDYTVTVDDMAFEVDPAYGHLFGTGTKSWTWVETACFGNGHAYAWEPINIKPEWWILNPADITTQCTEKGFPDQGAGASMTFTLSGKKMVLSDVSGTTISEGTLDFNMAPDGNNWAIGTLAVSKTNILFGYDLNSDNAPWNSYYILELNDSSLILGALGAGNTYWFWVFKPA